MNLDNKTGIIIQARMGSKRLPGKVMKKINGKPLIYYLLKRVQLSSINNIFVATSVDNNNKILLDYLSNNFPKIITYKGSEDNVFSRYLDIARKYSLSTIIRLTADCPLIDYRIINEMYDNFKSNNLNLDYFSNTTPEEKRTYPDGMDVEIFTLKALEKANKLNLTKSELEHVTPCFLNNKYDFKTNKIDFKTNLSYLHLSVDYQHNFDLIERIINELLIDKIDASLDDILKVL